MCDAKWDEPEYPGLYKSITGMIFFGTPFRGSSGMNLTVMLQAALRENAEDGIQVQILEAIVPGNEVLINLVDDFMRTRKEEHRARVACFCELRPSNIGAIVGGERRVVSVLG